MTAFPLLWVNGRRLDVTSPTISALDRGFTRGDGVFETIRIYDAHPFELERHLVRLHRSAQCLALELPGDLAGQIMVAAGEAAEKGLRELALRLTVTRGPGMAPGLFAPAEQPTVVIALYELQPGPARIADRGAVLHVSSAPRNERALTAGAKTLAYAESIAAVLEANAVGAEDALMLDTRGYISEGTTANIFFVREGVLLTPSLDCGILEGVTRGVVLEIAKELDIHTREGAFPLSDLLTADEAFLTSSIRELLPVIRIDSASIGDGRIGPVTQRLVAGFADRVLSASPASR